MNGRQELLRVVSLVDMEKVDLPSYNISMRKFDDVAHTYSKVLLLASVVALNETGEDDDTQKRRSIAVNTIDKLIANPNAYSYDECSRAERNVVNQAAEEAWGNIPMSKTMQNAKQKAKNNLMIKNLKGMLSLIKSALDIYPDVLLDKYMDDAVFFEVLNQLRIKQAGVVSKIETQNNACEEVVSDEQNDNDAEASPLMEKEESHAKVGVWVKILSFFKRR